MPRRRTPSAARFWRPLGVLLAVLGLVTPVVPTAAANGSWYGNNPGTYHNPLRPRIPGDGTVDSCADPTVIKGRKHGDRYWYMYCTTDPLNDDDRNPDGSLRFHRIPTMRSLDLVHWKYVGDAFRTGDAGVPSWADPSTALWAPEVVYSKTYRKYYMFVTVTETKDAVSGADKLPNTCRGTDGTVRGDSAIGMATAPTATGPWTFTNAPVVAPRRDPGSACGYFWTFDPDVLGDSIRTRSVIYYGSYYGGVFGQHLRLTRNGAHTTGTPTRITIGNRYEGTNVVRRGDWYYFFGSATNCCNGPLTGYSVFAGRSRSPLGPFVDREGNSLLAGRVGGTPVISMNGNRWMGTGHNTVFRDYGGQWWTIYHAVDRTDPYFRGSVGFTKRPALLDALDWVNGWPTVNGGRWASDSRMPAPAAQPGQHSRHRVHLVRPQVPGRLLPRYSDSFSGRSLDPAWHWIRRPAVGTWGVGGGVLQLDVQVADLNGPNNASVLVRRAPARDYVVQTRVKINFPDEGCCQNYAQAGLVVYRNDDNYIKLTNTSIWETRQTEFAKEVGPVPTGYPTYGNTVVGAPGRTWTYLRIAVHRLNARERRTAVGDWESYTAYTSQDGHHWVRGGTWTHRLGTARIGLVAQGLQPTTPPAPPPPHFTATFDYVKVWTLRHSHWYSHR